MSKVIIYDSNGKQLEQVAIDFKYNDISEKNFSNVIRVLLQNWRQGTVSCKNRGDVAFSNKKPWKQKGTGRARSGTKRSPIWRKGGVVFGPNPRTRKLSINREQIRYALNNVYNIFKDKVFGLDFDQEKPSTKAAYEALRKLGLDNKKVVLFLSFDDVNNFAAFRNIPNLKVVGYSQPNVYDLVDSDSWLFLKKDLDLYKNMVSSWN